MTMKAFNYLKDIEMKSNMQNERDSNKLYIFQNRSDLAENFPNRWVAIKDGRVQLADVDLFDLFKIMIKRGEDLGDIVFYLCNLYENPLMVTCLNN
jgi:hypothetical protein